MAIAVERNAEREAGSNMPARLARGLEEQLEPASGFDVTAAGPRLR